MSNENDPGLPDYLASLTPEQRSAAILSGLDALRMRLLGVHLELSGEDLAEEEPMRFTDLNNGEPHQTARTGINDELHRLARVDLGIENLERAPVPGDGTWEGLTQSDEPYNPPFVDIPRANSSAAKEGDAADPEDPNEVGYYDSLEGPVEVDDAGYPLNPVGPTGLRGRGMLNKWGATQAADPILTRNNPETNELEVLLIERGDTGELGFPGGKVDENEEPREAAGREMLEEAAVRGIDPDFSDARVVYEGYVDDSRNTDNAWMETTALHRHLTPEEAGAVQVTAAGIHAGEINAAGWHKVDSDLYGQMFGSHGAILQRAVETMEQDNEA